MKVVSLSYLECLCQFSLVRRKYSIYSSVFNNCFVCECVCLVWFFCLLGGWGGEGFLCCCFFVRFFACVVPIECILLSTDRAAIYANRHYLAIYKRTHPERLAVNSEGKPRITGDVFIHPTAQVHPTAVVRAPPTPTAPPSPPLSQSSPPPPHQLCVCVCV